MNRGIFWGTLVTVLAAVLLAGAAGASENFYAATYVGLAPELVDRALAQTKAEGWLE